MRHSLRFPFVLAALWECFWVFSIFHTTNILKHSLLFFLFKFMRWISTLNVWDESSFSGSPWCKKSNICFLWQNSAQSSYLSSGKNRRELMLLASRCVNAMCHLSHETTIRCRRKGKRTKDLFWPGLTFIKASWACFLSKAMYMLAFPQTGPVFFLKPILIKTTFIDWRQLMRFYPLSPIISWCKKWAPSSSYSFLWPGIKATPMSWMNRRTCRPCCTDWREWPKLCREHPVSRWGLAEGNGNKRLHCQIKFIEDRKSSQHFLKCLKALIIT